MQLQGFFKKPKNELEKGGRTPVSAAAEIHAEPGEICPARKKSVPTSELWENNLVCSCGYHFRMNAGSGSILLRIPAVFAKWTQICAPKM